jgi:hypothetical protein
MGVPHRWIKLIGGDFLATGGGPQVEFEKRRNAPFRASGRSARRIDPGLT